MNRARKDPIWRKMRSELTTILGPTVEIVFPAAWSKEYSHWFHNIEQDLFRPSLTYSEEEIMERLNEADVLLLFIAVNGDADALVLGYTLTGMSVETFYLDTIAVRQKGRGIGRIILTTLIQWAKKMGYGRMQLDTEFENEVGFRLSSYYERFGFKIIDIDEEIGNITMQLTL